MKCFSFVALFSFTLFLSQLFTLPLLAANSGSNSIQVQLGVDGCNNNGACEALIGETILSCPNDCTPAPPVNASGGSSSVQFIYNVTIKPGLDFATIGFRTWTPVFATLRWGKTIEVTSGAVKNTSYLMDHTFYLPNLEPSTTYYFSIEYQDNGGNAIMGPVHAFRTLDLFVPPLIPNPSNVRTGDDKRGIPLLWNNPVFEGFSYIRVMRNTNHFYASPFTGDLVYEGVGEHVLDTDVQSGTKYYYTFFTRTDTGQFSSGVGIEASFGKSKPSPSGEVATPSAPEENFIIFNFFQNGTFISSLGGTDTVDGNRVIHIESIAGAFSGFQDLWMSVTGPTRLTNSYLLPYDDKKKIYQLDLPALEASGDYELRVQGFLSDKTVLLGTGVLRVLNPATPGVSDLEEGKKAVAPGTFPIAALLTKPVFWLGLILTLFLLWLRKKVFFSIF